MAGGMGMMVTGMRVSCMEDCIDMLGIIKDARHGLEEQS